MGWERRKGQLYYYESAWEDGRCVKIYRGAGLAGKLAADNVAARAERKTLDGITFMRFVQKIEAAEILFVDARRQAGNLMEASLLADDCYQASHTWRRRRRNEQRKYN